VISHSFDRLGDFIRVLRLGLGRRNRSDLAPDLNSLKPWWMVVSSVRKAISTIRQCWEVQFSRFDVKFKCMKLEG